MTDPGAWTTVDLVREADFAIGDLRVRPSSREVENEDGRTVTLEPRVMQVLVALARNPGSVVSRDELIGRCWAGRIVGDDAIQRCIARLRRLADSHGGFAIETVAKVGYRFLPLLPSEPLAVASATVAHLSAPAQTEANEAQQQATVAHLSAPPQRATRLALVTALALAVVAFAGWIWYAAGVEQAEQAEQDQTVTQITELIAEDEYAKAFRLALPLVQAGRLEDDPVLRDAWQEMALPMKPLVTEDGATVYLKGYSEPQAAWIELGITPFPQPVVAPRGTLRLKVTKPGFRDAYFAVANPGPSVVTDPPVDYLVRNVVRIPLPLVPLGSMPDDMVVVPRTDVPVWVPGWTVDRSGERREVPEFAIGRTEVTNRQFKAFVDAGGYDNPEYWEGLTFTADGHELTWADARAKFVDSTQRPGPAGWQLSTYPAGQEEYPVGGISWYEAMAYARFRGQTLPTIHHWARAALAPLDSRFNVAPAVARASQFSAAGPVPADADVGIGPWGTLNMAGNVREWLWTSAGPNVLAPGGSWTDYAFENWGIVPIAPMDRSPENGMRLMQTPADAPLLAELRLPIHPVRDSDRRPIEPVSDAVFAGMRMQFDDVHVAPESVSIAVIDETPLAVVEEVTFSFNDAEPFTTFVVRPRSHVKPLQPIVFAPASNCCFVRRPNRDALQELQSVAGFVVDGGRALIMPVWFGSYERFQPPEGDTQRRVDQAREAVVAWYRDLRIALDYIATRPDMDIDHAGFVGVSLGAHGQAMLLALEPRLKAAVLISGGIARFQHPHPMADIMNYASRITVPVLMINGRTDHLYTYSGAQKPLFDLLGTDSSNKEHIIHDGGHYQYRSNTVARELTDWLDRHLGSAR